MPQVMTGKPLFMRVDQVRGFRCRELGRWSRKHLVTGAHVGSNGLRCFAAIRVVTPPMPYRLVRLAAFHW